MKIALEGDLATLGEYGRNPTYLQVVGYYYKDLIAYNVEFYQFRLDLEQIVSDIKSGIVKAQLDC